MNDLRVIRLGLRVFWAGLSAALILWIGLENVPPSGKLRVRAAAGEASPFVGIPAPHERVRVVEGLTPYYEITREPVYFPMAAPRFFRQARVRVEYQDDARLPDGQGQPLVELGARTSPDEWAFDLKPLAAGMLDRLGWAARQEGEYRVYEKKATSRAVGEILNFGDPKRVAIYGFEPPVLTQFHRLTWESDLTRFDTVVAKIEPPETLDGGWASATAEFDFGPLFVEHGEVQMIVSAPGMHALPAGRQALRIRAVSVEYQRPPWSLESFMDYAKRILP